jgi:hypothetical protein
MSEVSTKVENEVVESVPNAQRYQEGLILIKNVRASYPHVLKPMANKDATGKVTGESYSIKVLLPKETHEEAAKLCRRAITKILKESNKSEPIPSDRRFLQDGDPRDEDDTGKPEEKGCWVISARETKRPIVIDNRRDPKTGKPRRLNPDDPRDVERIYGGCFVNIMIRPWWQSNAFGKRVNAGLSVVQFVRDGEPFGTGRITDDVVDRRFEVEDEGEVDDSDYNDL